MKVLLLTTEQSATLYSELYSGLHKQIGSMDMRRLKPSESSNLKLYFSHHVDLKKFDRVIFHLEFSILKTQLRFLKHLENIIFYDTLTYSQEIIFENEQKGRLEFFKKLPWAKVIVSSYYAMRKFQNAGLDAWCVPEGFNTVHYANLNEDRPIELAFIESVNIKHNAEIKHFRDRIRKNYPDVYVEPHAITSGETRLNEVKIAVCADIGRKGYSGKIFQAMASGCLVMSYDQGAEETFFLSLKDMDNIVLFDSFEMFRERLNELRNSPDKVYEIAQKGYDFAMEHHQELKLGRQAANYIAAGVRERDDYGLGLSAFGFRF